MLRPIKTDRHHCFKSVDVSKTEDGLGEPTSTSRKRTGHVMLKPATTTWLKLAKQELSNKPRRPSGKQWISQWPLHSGRPHSTLPTNPAGISQIARRWTRPKTRTKSRRRNAQRSKQTDWKTDGGRNANLMAIRVSNCDHRTGISHLWRHVRVLSGKQPHNSPNKGVLFADKTYVDPN